jgi:ribosomal protein S18 acetylase RimI-like enzyme
MTAAYALSPQQLEAIVEERFDEESLTDAIENEDWVLLVAEDGESEADDEPVIVGFVLGEHREEGSELRWLFVDPEHRGKGVGTELYEAGSEALGESGTGHVTASVLEANTQGGTFFERVGLEEADERQVEIGEQSFVEYVYAEPSAIDESAASDQPDPDATDLTDADLPETETREGVPSREPTTVATLRSISTARKPNRGPRLLSSSPTPTPSSPTAMATTVRTAGRSIRLSTSPSASSVPSVGTHMHHARRKPTTGRICSEHWDSLGENGRRS